MNDQLSYIPREKRKKILFLCDDIRTTSGIASMAREIVIGTAHHYNWVCVGGAMQHPEAGQKIDMSGETDKRYSRIPKPKPAPSTARSRDDRLIQFCTKLMQSNTASVQMIELIERTKYKPEKMGLSLSAHMATLRLCQVIQSQSHPPTIVLVDDVRTEGTTFAACESIILQGNQSAKVIIKLSLALSQNPSSFQDLRTQHERS
jgi:hypothetical protein